MEPRPTLPRRFCIFCGRAPVEKTNEHVLPDWLIRLTGQPDRVMRFGVNPTTLEQPEFAYDQFVFPACGDCNGRYSAIEDAASSAVNLLLDRAPLSAGMYSLLLDWLDKVRIGLWLGYRYLHGNYMGISPTFTIDTRIAEKDRMVAVYVFEEGSRGLNAFAAETPAFQIQPSVFGLKVNHVVMINASWDYLCAGRCGFPSPESPTLDLDAGLLQTGQLRTRGRISHPVLRELHKPVVMLHQPILQANVEGCLIEYDDKAAYVRRHTWADRGLGCLFRQFRDRTVPVLDQEARIAFDSVSGDEVATMRKIVASVYILQNRSIEGGRFISQDPTRVRNWEANRAAFARANRAIVSSIHSRGWGRPET